jgi:Beta propeller domain
MTAVSSPSSVARRPRRAWLSLGLAATLATTGLVAAGGAGAGHAAVRPVPFRQYGTCPKLLTALRDLTLPEVGPYGLGGPYYPVSGDTRKIPKSAGVPTTVAASADGRASTAAPAAAGPAPAAAESAAVASDAGRPSAAAQANSSATNVQEAGIDEGDTVENDGRYLYGTVGGLLRIIDTTTGKQVADLGRTNGSEQLLLDGNRLAVVAAVFSTFPETTVTVWDVTDRTLPRRLSETHLEGSPVAVRNVGSRARIVLQTAFAQRLKFVLPRANDEKSLLAAQNENRRIVKRSAVDAWLPRSYVIRGNGQQSPVVTAINCREIGRPAGNVGLGFTWVATVDLNIPNALEGGRGSGGVIANGQTVYASAGNLYVATTDYPKTGPVNVIVRPQFFVSQAAPKPVPKPLPPTRVIAPQNPNTSIHVFDLTPPDGATYRASGTVPGTLLNQFSMSEWDGRLRVATSTQRVDFGTQQASGVHIFQRNGRSLDQIGVIDGLGRDERIYAVRFVGDLGYVVTFRQTDPLFVLDLRTPANPQLIGELKIPGYSSYLQPIGPGRLLGIGQDATDGGRVQGTQLSLFDVSDPRSPKRLAAYRIGGSSQAEYDHHAFLWWPATHDVIVPYNFYDPNSGVPSNGVVVASVTDSAITERGRVSHESQQPFIPVPGNAEGSAPAVAVPPVATTTGAPATGATTTTGGAATGGAAGILPPRPRPQFLTEPVQRSLIVNGNLVTLSTNAVKSSDLVRLGTLWYFQAA